MAERYQFGRNLPDGQPDEEYNKENGVTTGDEEDALLSFYNEVIGRWAKEWMPEVASDDIHEELTEILKISHNRLVELKVGEEVGFRILDTYYWIRVVEVEVPERTAPNLDNLRSAIKDGDNETARQILMSGDPNLGRQINEALMSGSE